MTDREGPTLVTPEVFYECRGCQFERPMGHKGHVGAQCTHPSAPYVDVRDLKMIGATPISDWPVTPSWCPLLPKGQSE